MKKRELSNSEHKFWLKRREFLKLGGAGVLGWMYLASTTNGASAQAQTPSLENIKSNLTKIRFSDYNPNYIPKWPIVIGLANGYLQDVGIEDVEVIESDQYIPGLIGGSIDIAHGDMDEFFGSAQASGTPITVISCFRQKEFWMMGVAKGIETAEDLKGKTISGGALENRNTWIQRQLLVELGLDPDKDVQFVPMSGASDNRLGAMIAGTLDAGSVFPRHRKGLEEAGGKILIQKLVDAPQEAFGAMRPWLDANEDAVYAFTLADIRARQWLFDRANKDQAYKMARDYGFEIPPEFEAEFELELDQVSPDGGFASAEAMDSFIAQLKETGGVPSETNWRDHIDMKYVWAAQEALGLPKRPASI